MTKITKTTYDYEEIETTKTTTKILAQSSPRSGTTAGGDNSTASSGQGMVFPAGHPFCF
mgnify:CR=1 FL=1